MSEKATSENVTSENVTPEKIEITLPPRYYTDPEIFAQERERIFFRSWLMVGHRSQAARPGDYFTLTLCDQNIFIMHGEDGRLRGFYNVCPHRAHELLPEKSGHAKSIVCPYHAWVFDTDGRLRSARGTEKLEVFNKDDACIPQLQVEVFCGFVFINMDTEAPPMANVYPDVEEGIRRIVPQIDDLVYTYHHSKHLKGNWKIAVENYNECYHCPTVHKAFLANIVELKSYQVVPGRNCLLHSARSQPTDKRAYQMDALNEEADGCGTFSYIWPTSAIQTYPGGLVNTYHWFPIDVENTVVYRSWFFKNSEPTPEQEALIELDRTTTFAEDLTIIDSVQRGLRSRGYQQGPLVTDPSAVGTTANENPVYEIKKMVLSALEPES